MKNFLLPIPLLCCSVLPANAIGPVFRTTEDIILNKDIHGVTFTVNCTQRTIYNYTDDIWETVNEAVNDTAMENKYLVDLVYQGLLVKTCGCKN